MYSALYRKIIGASIILIIILLIGVMGYWFIGGRQYSILDCLYMTFITITTIGFKEVIDLSSNVGGRVFTLFIAVAGIGVLAFIATNTTALLVQGELTKSFRRRKMEKAANKSKNHYIICGMGGTGSHIVNELDSTGRKYLIVDKDKDHIENIIESLKDKTIIHGDATEERTLLRTGIMDAKGIFALTGDDNQNLVISLTAKHLNPNVRVVAKCNDTNNAEKIRKAGADSVVTPTLIGGLRMASEMVRPTVVSFLDIMLRDKEIGLRVEEISVPDEYTGKSVQSLGLRDHPRILLLAIKTNEDWIYNPPNDYAMKQKDTVIFMATEEARIELEEIFRQSTQ